MIMILMKCKNHDYRVDMDCISSDEFLEVYMCHECGAIALRFVEIQEEIRWYTEDERRIQKDA